MLTLTIPLTVLTLLTAYLMSRKPRSSTPMMLMADAHQCVRGGKRIYTRRLYSELERQLPPLTEDDRL